ncbi:MAG TPA: hypothetical protein VEI07_23950 [Planctomycetaceae bacterium]|nr:hypothetical protein [Planctomycetaceae bacterium]
MTTIEATPKQPKTSAGRLIFPLVIFAILFVVAFAGFLFERDARAKEATAHHAEALNLRAQVEGLKHQVRSLEQGVASTRPQMEPGRQK